MNRFLNFITVALICTSSTYAKKTSKKIITLSSDNTISLTQAFNRESTTGLMQQATDMDANLKSGYPIYLFMYTPGGSIQAGLELIEFFEGLNRPVHTITLFSASMGWQTVQHLGERYILKYGVLMSHKARGGFTGEFGGGISQLDSRYQLWLRRIELMDKQTVRRTKGKQTIKSYTNAYTPELWLNGQEAVKKGYADAVVTVKCDTSMKGTYKKVFDLGFFKVQAVMSNCPMKISPLKMTASLLTNNGEMPLKEFLIKGGKFGHQCRDSKSSIKASSYFYEPELELEAELCASDKTLNLQKIRKTIEEKRQFLNRNLRDHIVYSY